MTKTFIDVLSEIHKVESGELFNSFNALFKKIRSMGSDELIHTKQSMDLTLKFSDKLNEEQCVILTHIIKAMQVLVIEHILFENYNSAIMIEVRRIFYIDDLNNAKIFNYNEARREFTTSEEEISLKKDATVRNAPKKRSWFGFLKISESFPSG